MSVSVTPVLPRVGRGGGTFASPRTKCRHFRTGTRALVCSRTGHAEGRTEGRTEVPARGEGRAGRALRAGGGRCELTGLSRRGPGRPAARGSDRTADRGCSSLSADFACFLRFCFSTSFWLLLQICYRKVGRAQDVSTTFEPETSPTPRSPEVRALPPGREGGGSCSPSPVPPSPGA